MTVSDEAAGERLAGFEEVYRRELVPISAVAIALTGDRELGADLAHEAMLRAFRDWQRVGAMDRPGAWIRRVVINLARDLHRRRERETRALRRLHRREAAPAADPDGRFWRAVGDLPERQREAVVLRYVEDLPVGEIATVLDVSDGTVKTSLSRARRTLARSLDLEDGAGGVR
jgi:RNA polymerase sigma-70 factor, ECF subfamily